VVVLVCVATAAWAQWPMNTRKQRVYTSADVTVAQGATYHEATVSDLRAGRVEWAFPVLSPHLTTNTLAAGAYSTTNTLAVLVFTDEVATTGTYRILYWR